MKSMITWIALPLPLIRKVFFRNKVPSLRRLHKKRARTT
uniref:Uncharacterized protein n=1 Tax=Arundo donax TaxID=35708 RepID=A0A0A9GXQ7_ARUDO